MNLNPWPKYAGIQETGDAPARMYHDRITGSSFMVRQDQRVFIRLVCLWWHWLTA